MVRKGREFEKAIIFKGKHMRGLGVGHQTVQIGTAKMSEKKQNPILANPVQSVTLQISEGICKLIQMDQL